jgi:hypothetical protein
MSLVTFSGERAQRTVVAPAARQPGVGFITGSGHGFPTRFTGQGRLSIFELGLYDAAEVRGKVVHLLACQTADQLGLDIVAKGCDAFFGYDVDFLFPLDKPGVFLDCDAAIDLRLADGLSAEEAYQAAIAEFETRIAQLKKDGQLWLASMLEFNKEHLCAPSVDGKWGNPQAQVK